SSILGRSRVFHAAKVNLDHGEWSRLWRLKKSERPPGTKRTADKYALIGQEFGMPNEKWPSHFQRAAARMRRCAARPGALGAGIGDRTHPGGRGSREPDRSKGHCPALPMEA